MVTDKAQDPESYQVYDEHLVFQDPQNAPHLISKMSQKQYLDAIRCPRIDPIKQGKLAMARQASPVASSEESDATDAQEQSSPESSEDEAEENLPPNVSAPVDAYTRALIEGVCRMIVIRPHSQQKQIIAQMGQTFGKDPDYSFFRPRDEDHPYFRWRVDENRAGRGYPPTDDVDRMRKDT